MRRMMNRYEELLNKLQYIGVNSVVKYKEYNLDRHENKELTKEYIGLLQEVYKPGYTMNIEELHQYFGEHLSDEMYLQLSIVSGIRIIISCGTDDYGEIEYRVIDINSAFLDLGLQEIHIEENNINWENPNPYCFNQF